MGRNYGGFGGNRRRSNGRVRIEIQNIVVSIHKNQEREIQKEIEKAGIEKENIESIHYLRRSIDSRKKQDIKFVYTIELRLKHKISATSSARWKEVKEVSKIKRLPLYPRKEIYIVGSGPAGLFAAYRLAEYGYLPIVLERGEEIEHRDKTTEDFIKTSILNPNSNIQFGEGGAGTYSDGKLNTRVKSEYIETIFQLFVKFGAPEEILWSYKPHVGTDILKVVVKNMREAIRKKGGKFYFNTLLEDIKIKSGELQGFWMIKNGIREYVASNQLILAIGHSSRDTYRMLRKRGLAMEAKAFAMGTRMEHPREEIDRMQYGKEVKNPLLEAATYAVTYNNSMEKRGTFSFCMCPGGVIVNAASQAGGTLVNGMSYSTRNGRFSNSAIVVGIKEHEFGEDLFSGMYFQESLEKKAYEMIGNYGAIYQNVWDFLEARKTEHEIESSYQMQKTSCRMEELFPNVIIRNLRAALSYWKKNPDFISRNVNLIAPETRTSAPLKILRDIRGESLNVKGLYPIGEGAGYAGGITSAAVDGMKIVDCAFTRML
ncbi:NAD(FAD)-utilizing dehydrogenase [Fusobacterium necrophorum BL]|uniref:NAD(FAD)-utilizing dehydrogenase n=1 Tax=Fusobacterium necrophorum BL TaxID=1441732 RepID=A0AB73BWK2_9FUSO|nr:NAD(FAD)-utilizing dehydrogenase [Fusobacterium necrophorum BL]